MCQKSLSTPAVGDDASVTVMVRTALAYGKDGVVFDCVESSMSDKRTRHWRLGTVREAASARPVSDQVVAGSAQATPKTEKMERRTLRNGRARARVKGNAHARGNGPAEIGCRMPINYDTIECPSHITNVRRTAYPNAKVFMGARASAPLSN